MVQSNNQLGVTLTARDQITATLKRVEQHTKNLDSAFGSLGNRLKTGIQWHILNNGLNMLDRLFRRVADAIPSLIHRGEAWASVVDDITDATGMSVAKASELAGVQQLLTGRADGLSTAFKALSKSVTENGDAWKAYGVEIARNKDGSVDAYGTFQNLRQAISATGASTLSFAAAQKLAGRGAADLLDLLTLTNQQWKAYSEQARKSGLILTEAGAAAAEQWGRTRNLLDSAFTGIGAQVLQGVAPTLIGLANAVTTAIQNNMANIVRFVSGAIAFVAGLVSQFLGIDLNINIVEQLDGAGRAATKAAPALRQQGQEAKRTAAAQKDLAASTKALRDAERELKAARADMPFHGDMSDADYILARQARSARIAAAQERVEDAKKALSDHRRTMGAISATTAHALDVQDARWRRTYGKGGTVVGGLKETLADAKTFGRGIADAIQDAIFGPDTQIQLGGGKPITVRSGGLLKALQDAGGFMRSVAEHVGNLNRLLDGSGGLIAGVIGLVGAIKLLPGFPSVVTGGASILGSIGSLLGRVGGGALGAFGIAGVLNTLLRQSGPKQPDEYGPFGGMGLTGYDGAMAATGGVFSKIRERLHSTIRAYLLQLFNGRPGQERFPNPNARPDLFPPPGGFSRPTAPLSPSELPWDLINSVMPGFGVQSWRSGIDALGEIERSLGVGGTATSILERIESAMYAVETAVENLDLGGGSGSGSSTLVSRVTTLERQMTGVEGSALQTANQRQDKSISGLRKVNVQQGRAITDVRAIAKVGQNFRNDWKDRLPQFGRSINDHERRLDELDGGGGTNPDRRAPAAAPMRMVVQLDRRGTREFLRGAPVTTSLKPA